MLSKALVIGAYQRKAEELARLPGVELTVVVPPFWNEGNHRIDLQRTFVEGYRLAVEPMAFNGNFHMHYYPRLGRLVREVRPDVFHIDEEPYNLATLLAMRLAKHVGARALFFTWQNILRRLPPPFSLLERYNYANAHWAIAGSQGAKEILSRKGFRRPIGVIPQFGVDPALYSPDGPRVSVIEGRGPSAEGRRAPTAMATDPHLNESRPVPFTIGYVGRITPAKGLALLLEAVPELPGDWHLVFIGEGPMKEELRKITESRGLSDRVSLVPYMRADELPARLRALDVVVLPSMTTPRWKEQFGRVLVEAMACGVPVVGSDSGEIPHVIGDAGLVFPEGSVEHLRQNLGRVMVEADLRASLAQRGRERVLALFSQERVARETYEVYQGMLRSGREGTPDPDPALPESGEAE